MRLVAMEGLVNLVETDAIETLRTVVKTDKDPVVREGALRCLVILKEKPPVILTVMIDAMEDPDVDMRAFAATLLLKGTTQVFPFEPGGDSTARAATVAAWREWYEKNKERLFWNAGKRRFEVKDEKGK
jgi:HEAT repeat protein